jgi:hypothetical protein
MGWSPRVRWFVVWTAGLKLSWTGTARELGSEKVWFRYAWRERQTWDERLYEDPPRLG